MDNAVEFFNSGFLKVCLWWYHLGLNQMAPPLQPIATPTVNFLSSSNSMPIHLPGKNILSAVTQISPPNLTPLAQGIESTTQPAKLAKPKPPNPIDSKATSVAPKTSKSKSKSKKCEPKKPSSPETSRKEEEINLAVHQILAQAVQQQREQSLQPQPVKQGRKRGSRQAKPQQSDKMELGKLQSISDTSGSGVTVQLASPVARGKPGHLPLETGSDVMSTACHVTSTAQTASEPGLVHLSGVHNGVSVPHSSFVEQTLSETTGLGSQVKKSMSLKDHLSSIVKEGGRHRSQDGCHQTGVPVPVSVRNGNLFSGHS